MALYLIATLSSPFLPIFKKRPIYDHKPSFDGVERREIFLSLVVVGFISLLLSCFPWSLERFQFLKVEMF